MDKNSKIRIGIVGLGRGNGFIRLLLDMPETELAAICDMNARTVDYRRAKNNVPDSVRGYTDFDEMIENEDLDAVFVATPIRMHFSQARKALEHDLHVLGEVPAVYSVEEAKQLTEAAVKSKGSYMIAENANYFKFNLMVNEMARAELFGDIYYAEAEYLHDLKSLNSAWRYDSLYGRNGIVYGTHSLGPVLSWMRGDRVKSVSCAGSGRHFNDLSGKPFELEDTCVMMCRTEMERLIKIRIDFVSPRPCMNRYQLQGTRGAYESQYHALDIHKVAFADEKAECGEWTNLFDHEDRYFPEKYKAAEATAQSLGHDGADYFMLIDYIDSLYNGKPLPMDIHQSLDMTLPGLISEQSIANGGIWLDVPDSRSW